MEKVAISHVRPINSLNLLSHREIEGVLASEKEVFRLFRQCALAVLNTGNDQVNAVELLEAHKNFDIKLLPQSRGLKLEIINAPASAFVDGQMIRGIQDHLFAALRDIVYVDHKITRTAKFDLQTSAGITDAVFRILRNANTVRPDFVPNLAVCWGGHKINLEEYEFSKEVGYQLGLRSLNIATGCGVGAMKGPMKGAAVGHAKQQIEMRRYIGITEPEIIASESPNPIVSELVIMPDIEKRLEAFVRMAHCIVVFPGGAGTAEEILYMLSLLLHPANKGQSFPLIFAAPKGSEGYFNAVDEYIRSTLGEEATRLYRIVIGDPEKVARLARSGVDEVHRYRRKIQESYGFNWSLFIDPILQSPFDPTHENMEKLQLDGHLPIHELAGQLRRAFSGIVAGNVKTFGIESIKKYGPFKLSGKPELLKQTDELLERFLREGRMKMGAGEYNSCYEISLA